MNALEEELRSTLRAKTDLVNPTMLRTNPEMIRLEGTDRVIQLAEPTAPAEWHHRAKLALSIGVAAAVAIAVGVTATHATHPRTTAANHPQPSSSASGPRSTIYPAPGAQAQPDQGWAIVLVRSFTNPDTDPQTVYRVSPTGQRTPVAQVSASYLLSPRSWNYDAGRVVLQDSSRNGSLALLDLNTGKLTPISLNLPKPFGPTDYDGLIGENILMWNIQTEQLYIITTDGQIVTRFPGQIVGDGEVASPDGRQVAAGTNRDVTLFDAANGQVLHHWAVPKDRSGCGLTVWLPNDSVLQGTCDPTANPLLDEMNFPLASTTPTSAVLPGGWATIRLPNGTFAFRTSHRSVFGGQIGLVDKTEIAWVDADATLHPVSAPPALHGWTYAFGNSGLIAIRGDVLHPTGVASWNPISGQLSVYYSGAASSSGYAVWGG